jgi:hypothetical protein
LPEDAERLLIWFSYTTTAGAICYDSDYGANYRFGFPCREIDVTRATVIRRGDAPADQFDLAVTASADVQDVAVQFSFVADPDCVEHDLRLQRAGEDPARQGAALWTAAVDVPHGAIVRFRLCYWIGGRRLTDDNTGAYYLAPQSQADAVPPPPPALIKAAADWR